MKECERQLREQPCQQDLCDQIKFDAGFEAGWGKALKWAAKTLRANYLKEKTNPNQYIDEWQLDSLSDIKNELGEK